MAELDCNLYSYTIPSSTILEHRRIFYTLKRETDERTQTWLKRLQWHINRCAFPKIIEFLLIDKFMCELHYKEIEFARRIETWTLNRLLEYVDHGKITDGPWVDGANMIPIDSSQQKTIEFYEIDPLSMDTTLDISNRMMWTVPNESAEIDGINEIFGDSEILKFPDVVDSDDEPLANHLAAAQRKTKRKPHRNTTVGAYTCDQCKKTFTRLDNLNVHKKHFHPEPNTSNACVGGKHAAEKRFHCDQCAKSFIQSSDLRRHKEAVHLEIRPFPCDQCEKSFTRSSHLNDHKKNIHDGIKPKKPFNCDQCEYSFTRKSHLKKHMLAVHDKVRPHTCTQCDKSFTELSNFKRHMQRSHPTSMNDE